MALPSWPFARAILVRSFIIWAGIRAALLMLRSGVHLSLQATLLLILVTTALATLEGRRRNEHIFLANLGVPLLVLVCLAAAVPTLLEVLIWVGGRA